MGLSGLWGWERRKGAGVCERGVVVSRTLESRVRRHMGRGQVALAVPVRLCRCWTAENGKEPGQSGSEGLSFVPKVADGPRGRKPASLCRCLLPPGNVRRAPLAVHMQLAHNCSLRTSQLLPGPFCPACGSQPPPCFSWGCGSTLSPSSPLLVAFSQLRMVHRWSL